MLAVDRKRRTTIRTIVPRGTRDDLIPLSYAQERLWFLDQLGLVGAVYNLPIALRLSGELAEWALERSFSELVRRHESLRTHFGVQEGVPHQLIETSQAFELHRVNLSQVTVRQQREEQLSECIRLEQQHRFDLGRGPLLRVVLVTLGPGEYLLLLTIHHIVSDGWSLGVLMHELSVLYAAHVRCEPNPLPELTIQYADYAIWQRRWLQGGVLQEHLQYWKQRLLGAAPQLELPTDRPRPPVERFKGAELTLELPATLYEALRILGRQEGATLFMVSLAAYQILLSRWTGEQDVVVGSPVAGRENREIEGLIGLFVNTLVLRTEVSGELTFRQLLQRVKEVTLGAYAHQELPFESLVKELRPERNLARQPIFQVALALQNYPTECLKLPGLTWTLCDTELVNTHVDLTLYLHEHSDGLSGVFHYATDLFDKETIERIARHFQTLLQGIAANPDCLVAHLPLLGEAEKHQLLVEWNATAVPYPQGKPVHEMFEQQVEKTPDAVAVVCGEQQLTYMQLNSKANQLARHLRSMGVGPDQLVAICIGRSLEMVVGLLGVFKAGGAYVPMDPIYPTDRLAYMLQDAAPGILLTQETLRSTLPVTNANVIALDSDWTEIAKRSQTNLPPIVLGVKGLHLAYVIYTSGSTGLPKGVMVEHAGLSNLACMQLQVLGVRHHSRVLQFASLSFDASIWECVMALCAGARLCLASREELAPGEPLLQTLHAQKITHATLPPVAIGALPSSDGLELDTLVVAGEACPAALARQWTSERRFINAYGPTEATICATMHPCEPQEAEILPIGRPIANTQIYILDRYGELVPVGVVGEIHIGGAGVARGYLNRPELTAQRFIADPFSVDGQGRMYKTGDRGRWNSDGTIVFLGRDDGQVKIRGFRIELGEIEAQLAQHTQVRDVVVISREDVPGEKRLVAYFTLRDPKGANVEGLRSHLKAILPEHMIPSAFVLLHRFPLTPNGKLDRRSLAAPDIGAFVSRQYDAPQGDTEETLAAIWCELLRVTHVGRQDNFFELGGHSLNGMKLISKVAKRFIVNLSAIAVFQYPTIQQMAKAVESLQAAKEEAQNLQEVEFAPDKNRTMENVELLKPGRELVRAPLTFSQLAHWRLYRLGERRAIRQIASAIRLRGQLDVNALQQSVALIVNRHDVLRTRVVVLEGVPVQEISEFTSFEFKMDDLTTTSEGVRQTEVKRIVEQHILEPIDVAVGPLFGVRLVKLQDDESVLVVAMEHIISDYSSLNILLRDLFAAYAQISRGCACSLPEIPVQFSEYALWQRTTFNSRIDAHSAYWNERLSGCERVSFPDDRPAQYTASAGWKTVPLKIGKDLKEELREWCRLKKTTLAMSIFTAYAGLVLRWCNVQQSVIRYQSDGRTSPKIENTLGYFASVLYLRVELLESDSFVDLMHQVTKEYCGAYEHTDSSYLSTQVPSPAFAQNTIFNWVSQGSKIYLPDVDGSELTSTTFHFEHPMLEKLELDLEPGVLLYDTEEEIIGEVHFPLNRFSVGAMERFGRNFLLFIETLLREPEMCVRDIPLCG